MEKELFVKVDLFDKKDICHKLTLNEEDDHYTVICMAHNGEEMGSINFGIKDRHIWLYRITVDEKFQHQGIGTALIYAMEYIALNNNLNKIEAKYYPSNEFAKPFYKKLGYYIPNESGKWEDYDETWTMYKYLDFNEIRENIVPRIRIKERAEEKSM